ncbi:efflux transporter outer membrane subunit [Duganella callida]|uniref:efflux transporter outer membrane subunit n=1 Tax=Duganella callida TaxID=2561932 RepID=UPI001E4B509F|nr:efflux transporter outer membrane subunit [Duganella callida]
MRYQIKPKAVLLAVAVAALLPGCASFDGIGSEHRIAAPAAYQSARALADEHGNWPAADWAGRYGDAQLSALIAEALRNSPTLEQAMARVAAAAAVSDSTYAAAGPKVNLDASITRQKYSANALVPPPVAGSWQTENKAVLSASYELDVWGKHRAAESAAVSRLMYAEADKEKVKLTLSTAIARSYNELARLYALRDLAGDDIAQRRQLRDLSAARHRSGLDTEVEPQNASRALAASQTTLAALDGQILDVRYQLAALLGAGPDRGLDIARPQLNHTALAADRLPDNLPADLVARRPDIAMARWRVEATTSDIKVAKAEFYPDINLGAAIGLDAFGFGRFLDASSRTISAGPALHLPVFDSGALRAQLKGRYAEFDQAVAGYNQTLVGALSDVATQIARVRSTEAQLADAQAVSDAARRNWQLAASQYKAGLNTQQNLLQARVGAIAAEQTIANLRMARRDQQIALAAALGGGYGDNPASK